MDLLAFLVVLLACLPLDCKPGPDVAQKINDQHKLKRFNFSSVAEVGKPAPEFSLPTLGEEVVSLSELRGKVVLVNFWATWCAPCITEMPSMEVLNRQFRSEDFLVLAVSIDADQLTVSKFVSKYGLTFKILLDQSQEVGGAYGITGVPETFIIDKEGILIRKYIGPYNWSSRRNMLYFKKLLNGE